LLLKNFRLYVFVFLDNFTTKVGGVMCGVFITYSSPCTGTGTFLFDKCKYSVYNIWTKNNINKIMSEDYISPRLLTWEPPTHL